MTNHVIDSAALQRLLEVIGGDPDDLAELAEDFETVTPEVLAGMQRAAETNDIESLRISAHSLKSNSRDFGAMVLAASCEALERDCRDGTVVDPMTRVSIIGRQLDDARAAIKELVIASE